MYYTERGNDMTTFGVVIIEDSDGLVTEIHGTTLADALVTTNKPNAEAWLDGEYVGRLYDACLDNDDAPYKCDGCGNYFHAGDTYVTNSGSEYCYDTCLDRHNA
jgi:hypothetical protein